MSFFVGSSPAGAVGAAPAPAGFAGVGVTRSPADAGVTPDDGVDVGVAVGVGVGVPNHPGGYVPSPPPPPPLDGVGLLPIPTVASLRYSLMSAV